MKHTRGPWFAINYACYWNLQSEDGYSDNNLLDEAKNPDAEANAKLMAASPDLLNALQILVAGLKKDEDMYSNAEKITIAETAIKKAIG